MSDDVMDESADITSPGPDQAQSDGAQPDGAQPDGAQPDQAQGEPSGPEAESVAPAAGPDVAGGVAPDQITEEALVALIAERDEYLEALQRLKAEFANARRRSDEQATQRRTQAAADLVEKILPVLDSCDAALAQGIEQIQPVADALYDVLSSQGLERVDAVGEAFDPELHEAVLYEEGEGDQVVIETLRTGYRWNDRVLRAPMVKVQG